MTESTSGTRAAAMLFEDHGFRSIDVSVTLDGLNANEMADITGRRILLISSSTELIKAIPMGEWVRDIERAFLDWPNRPYVTTVIQLERLMERVGAN